MTEPAIPALGRYTYSRAGPGRAPGGDEAEDKVTKAHEATYLDTEPEVEVQLPFEPPDDISALVYGQLGVVAEVHGPARSVDADVVLVFVGAQFAVGLLETFGTAAAGRLMTVLGRLRRSQPGPDRRVRDVHVVVRARLEAVIDENAVSDERAGPELLRVLASAADGSATLRWDRHAGAWLVTAE